MENRWQPRTSDSSVFHTRHTRKPLTPSSITTLLIVLIFSRLVTTASVALAASWSIQGTKKLYPGLSFFQLIWNDTVSIFIFCYVHIHLQEL